MGQGKDEGEVVEEFGDSLEFGQLLVNQIETKRVLDWTCLSLLVAPFKTWTRLAS